MAKIVCFGPGPRFKGGISNYNTSLAKALDKNADNEVHIVSWTNQYPSFIPRDFLDKSSKADLLDGTDIEVHYLTNYNNPFSWLKTAKFIANLMPDKVIFQWAISIQGLPMGYISRWLQKNSRAEIIFDLHNVIQKESSFVDIKCTKMGIRHADTYVVHGKQTIEELKLVYPQRGFSITETGERRIKEERKIIKLFHPVYDMFEPNPDFDVEAFKKELGLNKHVFLFFGFIRKYKGLHNAIQAFKKVVDQRKDVSFLICGEEFWSTLQSDKLSTKIKQFVFDVAQKMLLKDKEREKDYRPLQLIEDLGLQEYCVVKKEFIANEEVHKYFQVSDACLLYYVYATPSGIELMNFKQ